jgi:hypothetical protein
MFLALFLPFVGVDCRDGCTSPALAPVSLAGSADDRWLLLSVVLAFGLGSLLQILTHRGAWLCALNLGMSLLALSLAVFEGIEAGTRVLQVELINLFTPTALLAGYFVLLVGAALGAASTGSLFLLQSGSARVVVEAHSEREAKGAG